MAPSTSIALDLPKMDILQEMGLTTPPTASKTSVPTDRRPIVISGPSGVGKGTLYKMLLDKHPGTFSTSISHTTREPRPGEVRDQDYYYVSMQEFEDLIERAGFVEHAKFGGNRYGTSRKMIEEMSAKGKVVLLDIEMEVSLARAIDNPKFQGANGHIGCQASQENKP
jgi:guanylate kinase